VAAVALFFATGCPVFSRLDTWWATLPAFCHISVDLKQIAAWAVRHLSPASGLSK
jgi:hypothetical protein